MPEKKNQHFVPRFLMRNFGVNKRQTNLYNFCQGKTIACVGIKEQCAKDYFYSKKPTIEDALSKTEGRADAIFKNIMVTGSLPPVGSEDHVALTRFVALQHGRTEGAVNELHEMLNDVGKKVLGAGLRARGDQDELLEHLPSLRLEFTNAPLQNILQFSLMAPLLRDLEMQVFRASVTQDFILGDDPVIVTNKYLFDKDGNPRCGLSSKGLIVILPFSPTHTLVLRDPQAYEPARRAVLTHEQTIEMNLLQARHAVSNVYFRDQAKVSDTLDKCASIRHSSRIKPASVVSYASSGRRGLLVANERQALRLSATLDLYKVRFSAKRARQKKSFDPTRNPRLAEFVKHVMSNPGVLKEAFKEAPDEDGTL